MSVDGVLLVSIDSLRRDVLGAYDESFDYEVATPNLDRFAERAVTFDTHYAGSLPCMPTRREWFTGIREFLWRPWGPLEPFDRPLPRLLRQEDTVTQLVTDHFHYFQHGSHGYYEDFHGFEFVRGHEDDAWKTTPRRPDERLLQQIGYYDPDEEAVGGHVVATAPEDTAPYRPRAQYARNVAGFDELDESTFFAAKVFGEAASWVRANEWDNWFCYVDSFDVHEPFHSPEPYASMYTDEDPRDPDLTVWPFYGRVDRGQSELDERNVEFVRSQYAGKVTMVDRWFGRLLDALDAEGLWDDTAVVVTSDHGFMLGEHGWMGKPTSPKYEELVHTPLLVWHPDSPRLGETVTALTSAVDLYATLLEFRGVTPPEGVHSRSLGPLLAGETDDHRDWALYGYWGQEVNVTDGEYTYHRPYRRDEPAHVYSTTMMDGWGWMTPTTPKTDAEAGQYLPYTESPVWRFAAPPNPGHDDPMLFDVATDPRQRTDLAGDAPAERRRMECLLREALSTLEAPEEQWTRLGLEDGG